MAEDARRVWWNIRDGKVRQMVSGWFSGLHDTIRQEAAFPLLTLHCYNNRESYSLTGISANQLTYCPISRPTRLQPQEQPCTKPKSPSGTSHPDMSKSRLHQVLAIMSSAS